MIRIIDGERRRIYRHLSLRHSDDFPLLVMIEAEGEYQLVFAQSQPEQALLEAPVGPNGWNVVLVAETCRYVRNECHASATFSFAAPIHMATSGADWLALHLLEGGVQ
tara:strand:- start:3 stop:326 length:324 start_codon:yes stop_codon:yes gene_type:complete